MVHTKLLLLHICHFIEAVILGTGKGEGGIISVFVACFFFFFFNICVAVFWWWSHMGGAEQTDPLSFLGAQELTSSIYFKGAKELSLPSLMLSYCCYLDVLKYLWGAPERKLLQDSQSTVKPFALAKASLAGPVPDYGIWFACCWMVSPAFCHTPSEVN